MTEALANNSREKISTTEQLLFEVQLLRDVIRGVAQTCISVDALPDKKLDAEFFVNLEKAERIVVQTSERINSLLKKMGMMIEVEGAENLPNEPVIFLARHQSWWDTMGLQDVLVNMVGRVSSGKYVSKKELGKIPFFGLAMKKSAQIFTDRKTPNPKKLIKEIKFTLSKLGRDVIVFPETTRMLSGQMATEENYKKVFNKDAPIVPVYISSADAGRDDILEKPFSMKGRRITSGGEIVIHFGHVLSAKDIKGGRFHDFILSNVKEFELPEGEEPLIIDPKAARGNG